MKLSLGPALLLAPGSRVKKFYEQAAHAPFDVVYLGGSVFQTKRAQTGRLAGNRQSPGGNRQTGGAFNPDPDRGGVGTENAQKICKTSDAENGWIIEANDMAAVALLSESGQPFVAGPNLNIYNHHSLDRLIQSGAVRWVPPWRWTKPSLGTLLEALEGEIETELFGYGYLPLAHSARCYTARPEIGQR